MSTLEDRINEAIRDWELSSGKKFNNAELARTAKVSRQTVGDWRHGRTHDISGPALLRSAVYLNVHPLWLAEGKGVKTKTISAEEKNIDYLATPKFSRKNQGIPLISSVQAGGWVDAVDNHHVGDAEEWLPALPGMGKHVFALRVTGDSMTSPYPGQRSYPEGSIIYVDPDRPLENGRRVVAKFTDTNEVTFKQYREEGGKRYLQPLNPQYQMIEMINGIEIIGVVIHNFIPE